MIDRTVGVAGGRLEVWCDGGAGPAVVFLAAIGGDDTLRPIAERLAERANVCFYVRPGDGDAESPNGPRTAAQDAADLHQLLDVAEIASPVVLVGHSYGGLIAVVETARHPQAVAGVVLIDASHPEQEARFASIFTPEQQAISDAELDNFPSVDFAASLAEAGTALGSFPDVPLTVITARRGFAEACDDGLPCEAMQEIWLALQDAYAALTPDARHVVADTGHYVHDEEPDLVLAEIEGMLGRVTTAAPPP